MKSLLLAFCLFAFAGSSPAPASDKPNVIIVMTDDQGYPELSAHGNPVLETPHLDRVHAGSVRFSDFHVAPMCTPTRGQLLTGLDAAHNGAINVSSGRTLLRPGLPTMADLFAVNGYRTGLFGKWHLGDNFPFRPEDRGFEETLWFPSSHINSVPDIWENDYFSDTYRRNGSLEKYDGYCTDVFFGEAMDWIGERADAGEPFFLYLPTNAPHSPFWVPPSYVAEMEKAMAAAEASGAVKPRPAKVRENLVRYLAMIRNIDDNIGRMDAFLRERDLFDDTIFLFLTDNGSTFAETYYPAGMRGRKTQLWEGGHRVPCFVRWPGGELGEPRDIGGLTQVQDLLPTLAELCDLKVEEASKFDGISLAPTLRDGEPIDPERMLVINYSRMPFGFDYPAPDSPSLMRKDGAGVLWKRWRFLENRELYDLGSDPLQQKDVAASHPKIVEAMRDHLDAWWASVEDVANVPQRVVIGGAENPTMLTACEWLDVFIDQQQQIRRGDRKNGYWELDVAEAGTYEFELRRWPRESVLPLRAPCPASKIDDGTLPPGAALDISRARIRIGNYRATKKLAEDAESATFTARLQAGPTRLYTWFDDPRDQPLLGAYYVYVERRK